MKSTIILISLIALFAQRAAAQSQIFIDAQNAAKAYVPTIPGCHYDASKNIYIDNNKTIHIFLFEDGNLLLAGYPTTATEKSKFQLHLYVSAANIDKFLLEYTGSYSPVLNIENSNPAPAPAAVPGPGAPPPAPVRIDFAIIGPFTNTLVLTLKDMKAGDATYTTLTSTTVQISKTIYVSIGSGIVYSSLKNPSNIRKAPLADGDSTLIADDPGGRGLLTLTATYYPWGRNNLMMPSWSFKDRFGVLIGTSIGGGASNFQNVFLGGQYDFAIGGSVVAGLHYGRRQKIVGVDYHNFKFGQTPFVGDLPTKEYMGWDAGLFIGVQLDSRVFSQLFGK